MLPSSQHEVDVTVLLRLEAYDFGGLDNLEPVLNLPIRTAERNVQMIFLNITLCSHVAYLSRFLWLDVAAVLLKEKNDLKAQSPPEILELSSSAASLEAMQNSAGRRQSQPISISAAVAWAEYKAVDQRDKK